MKRFCVWFVMIDCKRVGSHYTHRETAESWVEFARKANHGTIGHVEPFIFDTGEDGLLDAESAEMLDRRYNMDAPVSRAAYPLLEAFTVEGA